MTPSLITTMLAIDKAYHSAGLLHRDISFGNIMITADGRGVLNDWDHAGSKDQLASGIVSEIVQSCLLSPIDHMRL